MNRNSIWSMKICAQIFILLIWVFARGHSQRYDKTTKCVYTSIEGVQTFEFVCEPNKNPRDYFTNGSPIFCDSDSGHSFYKERRHQILFQNCYWKQLPVIFKWYGAVRLLNASSLGLESLRSKNFDYAKNLVTLIASHNQLTEIPSTLFDDARGISVVDMSFNKINRIDPMAFNTDNNITLLNLSSNLISEIDNQTFTKLSRLETLDLSFNLMENIPDGLFDELNRLRHLNLGNNMFKRVECSVFANLMNLKTLDLTRNKLQVFNGECLHSEELITLFVESNELNSLNLSGNISEINASTNNITKMSIEGDLENMTVFNTSNNKIENILHLIKQFSSTLRILDVSDSVIGKLNVSTFEPFDNLEYLSLRNTSLSNIQYGTFHHQQQLRYLDISNNDLKKINFGILHWNSAQLERLHLDGNDLDDLSNLTRANYPSLKYVSIDNNNFDCDYLSDIQRQLRKDEISVVSNPHKVSGANRTDTHINGIACYHNLVASTISIDARTNSNEGISELAPVEAANVGTTESMSTAKIESLLICIVVVLICLLVISVIKNFVPIFKRNNLPEKFPNEPIYYRSTLEQQSLL